MSGGVDSSVAALLLKRQGYDVEGVFMKNWEDDDEPGVCTAAQDLSDAKSVCNRLGIPLRTVNFSQQYWDRVFTHCLEVFRVGATPNPDVLCNQEIKFQAFLDYCLAQGADKIATGHYARIESQNGEPRLLKGLDDNKDQSYFLYRVKAEALNHALFPIGELPKTQVRQIAETENFITHDKKDSTGICFIGERKFDAFLKEYLPTKPGLMKTPNGETVGQHDGLMFYTLGQRQGLQIGGLKTGNGEPWYVVDKNITDNVLVVAQGKDHPLLLSRSVIATDLNWVTKPSKELVAAKVRYRQKDVPCRIMMLDENELRIEFETPVRSVTPGQSLVLYDGDICLGGGIIAYRGNHD